MARFLRSSSISGDLDSAAAALEEGRHLLLPGGLQMFAPITLPLTQAEPALAQHQPEQALDVIQQVSPHVESSEAMGARRILVSILTNLAEVDARLSRRSEAATLMRQGETTLLLIA
jgi:hypothetical protein